MHHASSLTFLPLLALSVSAAPVDASLEVRASSSACPSYTIINTRGTGELQGQSAGFTSINSQVTSQLSGGKIYNTVYAADYSQNSAAGTQDIINKITSTLQSSPNECFILQGYSQGAAATVNALPSLTGTSFNAVKGVFLIGDPERKAGLACNVDNNGGTTTKNVSGLSAALGKSIPDDWISKTLDVCIYGDGVCDTTHGVGINMQHLSYPTDSGTQKLGISFAVKQLGA
ncbi:A cutinase-like protein from cryptococcus Sp [Truncatella angustata]|uniref:A cutinase-like protein from cryptococcus Sp n=1 Tax=Truncatella angustata TaxID=152316 RepID=A0A9P9A0C2_9PEZI|nr:A cutinase-like protein from cryptococcus Sp [Truncatella angustata]KAH6655960.1 A cutinase-like protein from cryptococcus Sp [Truncatella angustata]